MVVACRAALAEHGVCQLPGFLQPAAIDEAIAAALGQRGQAWTADQSHNIYFTPVISESDNDPRGLLQRSVQHAIAYDLLDDQLALCQLYRGEELLAFVAAALGRDVLYRSADALDALDISMFDDGDELGWHFDNSEFSITIMLQPAHAGGAFEFIPATRAADDERTVEIGEFLATGHGLTPVVLTPQAGTLSLFQGHRALHRVTPVVGSRTRINTVLTFGDRPEMFLTEQTRLLFYGR